MVLPTALSLFLHGAPFFAGQLASKDFREQDKSGDGNCYSSGRRGQTSLSYLISPWQRLSCRICPKARILIRTRDLSAREKEIVDLCVEGFTNEAIAHKLGVSVGTVNTYWLRIKLKVGGFGKTDTVAKIIRDRAELALREAELALSELNEIASKREEILQELRTASALLQFAMDHMKATVWATDEELCIQMLAYGDYPSGHFGVRWEAGKTVQELFDTEDPEDLAVKAHLAALQGAHTEVRLHGDFSNMILSVMPMADDLDEVIGCVSMLKAVGE